MKMNKMEWYHKGDIESDIKKIDKIFSTGIFSDRNFVNILFESAIIHVLIVLNDLLQKAHSEGKRINQTENIDSKNGCKDVTDLVNYCRNAVCHMASKNHFINENTKFSFNIAIGSPRAFVIGDTVYGSEFLDDIALYWGSQRLYLKRHVLSAFLAVREVFPDP